MCNNSLCKNIGERETTFKLSFFLSNALKNSLAWRSERITATREREKRTERREREKKEKKKDRNVISPFFLSSFFLSQLRRVGVVVIVLSSGSLSHSLALVVVAVSLSPSSSLEVFFSLSFKRRPREKIGRRGWLLRRQGVWRTKSGSRRPPPSLRRRPTTPSGGFVNQSTTTNGKEALLRV